MRVDDQDPLLMILRGVAIAEGSEITVTVVHLFSNVHVRCVSSVLYFGCLLENHQTSS